MPRLAQLLNDHWVDISDLVDHLLVDHHLSWHMPALEKVF